MKHMYMLDKINSESFNVYIFIKDMLGGISKRKMLANFVSEIDAKMFIKAHQTA